MPPQPLEQSPIGGVPHIYLAIITAPHQILTIGAPCHATDPDGHLTPDPAKRACSHLPQQQATPHGSAGQKLAIRTPGQAPKGVSGWSRSPMTCRQVLV